MDGVDGTADLLGDIGGSKMLVEDEMDGMTFDVIGKAAAWHGNNGVEKKKAARQSNRSYRHYHANKKPCNNASGGTLTFEWMFFLFTSVQS
jgi:hypothetical protein